VTEHAANLGSVRANGVEREMQHVGVARLDGAEDDIGS
jgi:hypothetical protein